MLLSYRIFGEERMVKPGASQFVHWLFAVALVNPNQARSRRRICIIRSPSIFQFSNLVEPPKKRANRSNFPSSTFTRRATAFCLLSQVHRHDDVRKAFLTDRFYRCGCVICIRFQSDIWRLNHV